MTQKTQHKWCAIDAEGDSGKLGLLGVAFYSDRFQAYLTDKDQIREYLEYHAEEGYTFLSHNASYDIPVIFWQLHLPCRMIYYNSRFNRGEYTYRKDSYPAEVWDTVGLSGGLALAQLGKSLGYPKLPTPQALTNIPLNQLSWTCDKHSIIECLECYAVRDAEICYRFMVDFESLLETWDIAPARRLAGISMNLWKKLDKREPINLRSKRIRELSREAYHGGRVETFKLGYVSPAYCADVCSMYPAMMEKTRMPEPASVIYRENLPVEAVNWWLEGVADVTVHVPEMYIPPLVYVDGARLKYPVGRFRTCVTMQELRYAMAMNCTIEQVHRIAFATDFSKPFANFISTLWTLRQKYEMANDPRTLFAKLLMNNLYGRIGVRDSLEKREVGLYQYRPDRPKVGLRERRNAGEVQLYDDENQEYFTNKWCNVMWAAQITAAARIELHRLMNMQGGNMVYCDTDSIFSMAPIVGLGEGLGALRDPIDLRWLYIAQPKLYSYEAMDGKKIARAKGVPKQYAEQFIRDGAVSFDRPVRPLEVGTREQMPGTWIEVTRHRQHTPHRREPMRIVSDLGPYEWTDTRPPIIG